MPSRSADTHFAIRKGSVSESSLPLLPDGSRVGRRGAARMSRLRDAASYGVFCGERRMHRFRLLQSSPGRAQDQRVRHGIESSSRCFPCANRARPGRAHHAQRWIFDLAALRTLSAVGRTKRPRIRSHAPAPTTAGLRNGSATTSSAVTPRRVRTLAVASSSSRGTIQEPPGLCAAGNFSGNFRSAQFLCGVYSESGFSTLSYCSHLLLWSRGELGLGHCGSLHHQQRLRRSGVHLITEGQ